MTAELLTSDVVLTGTPVARPAGGPGSGVGPEPGGWTVVPAQDAADLAAYHRLRHDTFVVEQGLFAHTDRDDVDDDPRTLVLLARTPAGEVLGGVRLHPVHHPGTGGRDLGWWQGSRLAVARGARLHLGVGAALVRAACATAEARGVLRFDACVQADHEDLFRRLGWRYRGRLRAYGRPHVALDWPLGRVQRLVDTTKSALGELVGLLPGPGTVSTGSTVGPGWLGDDGAPVPGTDLVAACDAILPAMVERDPEWAGWCAVLVNVNDLSAMGATPTGLLDALGARDASFARRVLRGLADAARAWDVPVLGGHTQLGVPAALAVTALGRVHPALRDPVPGGGGRDGDTLRLTADLGGGWRRGYTGAQWDSSSHRSPAELRALGDVVPTLAPAAAKDVSMTGVVGTAGMLAEASGCRAVVDVAAVPAPPSVHAGHDRLGDWLTCFPGFAVVTAERATPSHRTLDALPPTTATAACGSLTEGSGVGLRWPDGVVTEAVRAGVTGLGTATPTTGRTRS